MGPSDRGLPQRDRSPRRADPLAARPPAAGRRDGGVGHLTPEALRSGGLEILGQGTGTMPPIDVITGMLGELLDLLVAGTLRVDVDEVPLSAVSEVWTRDQRGCRPVFVP